MRTFASVAARRSTGPFPLRADEYENCLGHGLCHRKYEIEALFYGDAARIDDDRPPFGQTTSLPRLGLRQRRLQRGRIVAVVGGQKLFLGHTGPCIAVCG